ncbi:MAG: hypothetical protein VX346_05210 [Planctomycetota bacterium]|nr:hypothetical protein [Planctomycetota bacterium]
MARRVIACVAVTMLLLQIGCGAPTADSSGKIPAEQVDQVESPQAVAVDSPGQAVSLFLEALRDSDEARTVNLMTSQARKAVDSSERVSFGLQDTQGIEFQVGETRYLPGKNKRAHVDVSWDGTDVVFALREQESGWRIAGFAAPLVPNGRLEYLNFEDPTEMLAKISSPRAGNASADADVIERSDRVEQANARVRDATGSRR